VETECVAVNEKVPKEDAAVKTLRSLKERCGDQHSAVGRRRLLKKRAQNDCESRKKLAAHRRWMTRRPVPALRKGHGRQGPDRDSVARGALKGRTFKRRQRTLLGGQPPS
jgi:hypothetical protein